MSETIPPDRKERWKDQFAQCNRCGFVIDTFADMPPTTCPNCGNFHRNMSPSVRLWFRRRSTRIMIFGVVLPLLAIGVWSGIFRGIEHPLAAGGLVSSLLVLLIGAQFGVRRKLWFSKLHRNDPRRRD